MVEGYETEAERDRRLARAESESTAAQHIHQGELAAQVQRALRQAFERLRGTPHNCMIEVHGTTFGRARDVVRRRVPGWFIGTIGGASISGPGFAIDESGELHINVGGRGHVDVGERKEFASYKHPRSNRWWLSGLLELLERAGH